MALAAFTIENCWDASCICDFIEGNYDNDKCTRKDGKELEKAVSRTLGSISAMFEIIKKAIKGILFMAAQDFFHGSENSFGDSNCICGKAILTLQFLTSIGPILSYFLIN
ncbi:hypothetical protein WR25_25634 [Diploscapter pachys]|uniref:Uncharacterized protein n=1 Tax=Diploscapter pachys TaxID=2018661 RepID=A0A2A2KL78_9BILA|nr:hypothetical protein WR25_25634 [Diploscapter pachys]